MKKWTIYPKKSDDIIDQLLANRGIQDRERFFNPDYEKDLHNPFLLKDMKKAVARIKKAVTNKEKIGIFADYDADGIPGAALLFKVFKFLGSSVEVYIPTRKEGYGLNERGVRELRKSRCKLLVTVDLGIVNKDEVALAKKLGMDVIVTDHHEIQKGRIPSEALAILHPGMAASYPYKDLAGGGVAFKLVQAISQNLGRPNSNQLKWFLDLAAISTICDIVPLTGENRTITKYGLIVLNKTKNLGLKALYEIANIAEGTINPYIVGFWIGPRINAPGRLDHAAASLRLLVTENPTEAKEIAENLEKINRSRQLESERVLKEAKNLIEARDLGKKKIILVEGKDWPLGLVGLIAGRLMEEYRRPVLVFRQEKGKLQGSGRSIEKFHLLEALNRTSAYLTRHGGHARAAGVSLELKHLEVLYDVLASYAERKLKKEDLISELKIDVEIQTKQINFGFVETLKKFEPFGLGNPRPVFLAKRLAISDLRLVGSDGKHLKLKLRASRSNQPQAIERLEPAPTLHRGDGTVLEAIGFGLGALAKDLHIGDKVDIVFTLDEDIWNGRQRIQLKILDLKKDQ